MLLLRTLTYLKWSNRKKLLQTGCPALDLSESFVYSVHYGKIILFYDSVWGLSCIIRRHKRGVLICSLLHYSFIFFSLHLQWLRDERKKQEARQRASQSAAFLDLQLLSRSISWGIHGPSSPTYFLDMHRSEELSNLCPNQPQPITHVTLVWISPNACFNTKMILSIARSGSAGREHS